MSVYRKSYDYRGKRRLVAGYTIEVTDHTGQRRKLPTSIETKKLAQAYEVRLKHLIDHRRASAPVPDPLRRWVEDQPIDIKERLSDWGVLAPADVKAMEPISTMLDRWRESLPLTSTCVPAMNDLKRRAVRAFEKAGAAFWGDIDGQRVLAACHELGRTTQTKKHYWAAASQACRWIAEEYLKTGRGSSPLGMVKPKWRAVPEDEKHGHARRELTTHEIDALIAATVKAPPLGRGRERLDGPTRALVYQIAIETGLRANEIRTLTRGSMKLDSLPRCVIVRKTRAKNGKERRIPLRAELAEAIAAHLHGFEGDGHARIFPLIRNTARMIQSDMKRAGLHYKDPDTGAFADFHALRHTFISRVARTDLRTAQELADHSSINTTARYLHTSKAQQIHAIENMPVIRKAAG